MSKHSIFVRVLKGKRNYAGHERCPYELIRNGEVIKRGAGWGYMGAYSAGEKAIKRILAKEQGK